MQTKESTASARKRQRARDNYSDLLSTLLLKYFKNSGEKIATDDRTILEKEAEIERIDEAARLDLIQRHCEWMQDNFTATAEDCKRIAEEWAAKDKRTGDKSINILDFALSKQLNPKDAWGSVLKN